MAFEGYGSPAQMESVSNVTATPSVDLGTRRWVANREYVYVYNSGGATITQGLGVKVVTGSTGGYSVAATSLTDTVHPCVGIIRNADIAAGSYGWCQVKGPANLTIVSNLTADYAALVLASAGKFAELQSAVTYVGQRVAYVYNINTAAGGVSTGFINTGF